MNEATTSQLFPKPVIKAGIVFGVVSAVFALLKSIPILGLVFYLFDWAVGLLSGYVTISTVGGSKEKLADVIKHTAVVGLISGLISGIVAAILIVLGSLIRPSGIYYSFDFGITIFSVITAVIGGVIGTMILNVIGGIIQVYYTPDKLPAQVKVQLDKVVAFLKK